MNRRRIFYDNKVRLLFTGYLIFTLVLVLALFGNIFTKTFFSMLTPGFADSTTALPLKAQWGIFFLWTLYGFFFAYFYASNRVRGILLRLGRVCDQVASGEPRKMTFRKNDPFHAVSVSMNKIIEKVMLLTTFKQELEKIAKQADPSTRARLEEVMERLS